MTYNVSSGTLNTTIPYLVKQLLYYYYKYNCHIIMITMMIVITIFSNAVVINDHAQVGGLASL